MMSMLLWLVVLGKGFSSRAHASANANRLKSALGSLESSTRDYNYGRKTKRKQDQQGGGRNASVVVEDVDDKKYRAEQSTPLASAPPPINDFATPTLAPPSPEPTDSSSAPIEVQNHERKYSNATLPDGIAAAALSFTACEKLNLALEFMTALNFQEHLQRVFSYADPSASTQETKADFYTDVYILQLIVTPIFLAFLLFGARLFLHTFVFCAAAVGLFAVFGGAEGMLPIQLDCPMKLALSIISSFLCAVVATNFFRVGIFALGSLAFGGAAYVVFDAFPGLDPGSIMFTPSNVTSTEGMDAETQEIMPTSDLSTIAWVITLFFSAAGGIFLRYFEIETLEIATATIGGIGCAYSTHTFFLVIGRPVDPALIFLLAFFTSVGGTFFHQHVYCHKILEAVCMCYVSPTLPCNCRCFVQI